MLNIQKLGNPVFVIASAFAKADAQIVLGRQREVQKTYQQAIQLPARTGRRNAPLAESGQKQGSVVVTLRG